MNTIAALNQNTLLTQLGRILCLFFWIWISIYTENAHSEPRLAERSYALDTAIWSTPLIPVCWENINENAVLREDVRQAVADTWEAHSLIEFTGWGQCPAGFFAGIRIAVQDVGAHTKQLGRGLMGMKEGMVLNFTMKKWNANCPNYYGMSECVRWIAVHEFGHALGFSHEQNRSDTPDSCNSEAQGLPGNVAFTKWDQDSVMNYCNPDYNGFGELSDMDILTVQTYYGRISRYEELERSFQIPVAEVGDALYSGTLSDGDGDGKFELTETVVTMDESIDPAIYDFSTLMLHLPLVKFVGKYNHVDSLYSMDLQYQGDGTFTIIASDLIESASDHQ